jgi:hypothetical protein
LRAGTRVLSRVTSMKTIVSMLALALALGFTGPAFAGDVTKAKTEANYTKAGGTWDADAKTCAEREM